MKPDSLRPCPSSPNCVCSVYPDDQSHYIKPLPWRAGLEPHKQLAFVRGVSQANFRVELVQEEKTYLHLVFITSIFRFRDDVEFVIDASQKCIHVRSASRTGHSDLGTNQRRIEKIRSLLKA